MIFYCNERVYITEVYILIQYCFYFAPELCYNLMHFRNLHKGGHFKADILSTKQSIILTFVCFMTEITKTNGE